VPTRLLETRSGKLLGGVEVFEDLPSLLAVERKLDDRCRFGTEDATDVAPYQRFLASESTGSRAGLPPTGLRCTPDAALR